MTEREEHRGTTLLRTRRAGHQAPPAPGPQPTPRTTGYWPLLVLVIAGILALTAWALWPGASAGSGYSGDWKDTVATERAEGGGVRQDAGSGYSGDWKDTVATERAESVGGHDRMGPGYTGDWKDTVAKERAGSTAQ